MWWRASVLSGLERKRQVDPWSMLVNLVTSVSHGTQTEQSGPWLKGYLPTHVQRVGGGVGREKERKR